MTKQSKGQEKGKKGKKNKGKRTTRGLRARERKKEAGGRGKGEGWVCGVCGLRPSGRGGCWSGWAAREHDKTRPSLLAAVIRGVTVADDMATATPFAPRTGSGPWGAFAVVDGCWDRLRDLDLHDGANLFADMGAAQSTCADSALALALRGDGKGEPEEGWMSCPWLSAPSPPPPLFLQSVLSCPAGRLTGHAVSWRPDLCRSRAGARQRGGHGWAVATMAMAREPQEGPSDGGLLSNLRARLPPFPLPPPLSPLPSSPEVGVQR